MALETAKLAKKVIGADKDARRAARRMAAVADAQAERFGADLSQKQSDDDDDVNVYTNSPITMTTAPPVVQPSEPTELWKVAVTVILTAMLAFVIWAAINFEPNTPPPPAPIPSAEADLHIKVIPGGATEP